MRRLPRGHGRFLSVLLLAVTVLIMAGHVCALPSLAHAEAAVPASPAGGSGNDPEATHGGESCEAAVSRAVAPRSIALPSVPATTQDARAAVALAVRPVGAVIAVPPSRTQAGPSLFLLHASFLI
jgi:hypothetical protein